MKYILILLITFSPVFAQENIHKNIFDLKNDVQISNFENDLPAKIQIDQKKKNPGLALLLSLVLPGMGELYAGNFNSGKYFTISEGAIWGLYFGVDAYGNWQKDNYMSFAITKGGINPEGKDEDYYADISEFVSIDEFNRRKSLDREFTELYNAENFYWNWGDQNTLGEYRNMWESSERAYNNLRFVVGAMFVNRIISSINAVRSVNRYNKSLSNKQSWNISVSPETQFGISNGLRFNFVTSF